WPVPWCVLPTAPGDSGPRRCAGPDVRSPSTSRTWGRPQTTPRARRRPRSWPGPRPTYPDRYGHHERLDRTEAQAPVRPQEQAAQGPEQPREVAAVQAGLADDPQVRPRLPEVDAPLRASRPPRLP